MGVRVWARVREMEEWWVGVGEGKDGGQECEGRSAGK